MKLTIDDNPPFNPATIVLIYGHLNFNTFNHACGQTNHFKWLKKNVFYRVAEDKTRDTE